LTSAPDNLPVRKTGGIFEAPFHVNWNITYTCNFNCGHCYSRGRRAVAELSLQDKLRVAANIVHSKVFSVNLGGGEPLLNPEIFPVIEYLSTHKVSVALSSHGSGITFDQVTQLATCGLALAILSLDDVSPEKHDALRRMQGSHARCLESIDLFVSRGIAVRLSTVVTAQNSNILGDIADLARQRACLGVEFKRLRLEGNAEGRTDLELNHEQERLLFDQIRRIKQDSTLEISLVYGDEDRAGLDQGCPCGRTVLAIADNGDISACVYHPRALGNALVDDIGSLWRNSEELKRMRTRFACQGTTSHLLKDGCGQ
jgi:MoaA/NifB/PqqE/SkfB family radical SAM enzyme